ncbi:MAG TPA: MmcQ/YjbR family DNA-binding protein [Cyclobacteriaceae bacterium]|nr:MmcQ/YjbR family DNA-binding protein [Cyclobacteriaceae bacterium]
MVSIAEARRLAMEFPETVEAPHFEKTSFRAKKKIFMTMNEKKQFAVLKLTLEDQSVFSSSPDGSIRPVPNKWGLQGATMVDLKKVKKALFKDALQCSWELVASKKKLPPDLKGLKSR